MRISPACANPIAGVCIITIVHENSMNAVSPLLMHDESLLIVRNLGVYVILSKELESFSFIIALLFILVL